MAKAKPKDNTIRFKCTKCGAYLRVPMKLAGRYIDCPKCTGRTGVPDSQQEADAEGGEYGVKTLAVEVPDECTKCGEPLPEGTVFCTACGYDYRKGKFREGLEEVESVNAFAAWLREINWGKTVSIGIVVLLLGGGVFFGLNILRKRASGGLVNKTLFEATMSQIATERNVTDTFGTPRERIKMVGADLGGERFLSLETDAAKITAAGLDPAALKAEGYTMVTDVKGKDGTMMMIGKPDAYFLFYANATGAMMMQMEKDAAASEEKCNWAGILQKQESGWEIHVDAMGPVYGAGGDFRGYYWTQFFSGQIVQPDNAVPDLTFSPEQCWKLWKKGQLRDFRN